MKDVEDVYYVQSESNRSQYYRVTLKIDCECRDFEFRGKPCKHHIEILQYLVAEKNKNKNNKKS